MKCVTVESLLLSENLHCMHLLKVEYNVCMCEAYIIPTLETLKSIMLYWHTFIVLYIPIRIYKKNEQETTIEKSIFTEACASS